MRGERPDTGYRRPDVPVETELEVTPKSVLRDAALPMAFSILSTTMALAALTSGDWLAFGALLIMGPTIGLGAAARAMREREHGIARLRVHADGHVHLEHHGGHQTEHHVEELSFEAGSEESTGRPGVVVRDGEGRELDLIPFDRIADLGALRRIMNRSEGRPAGDAAEEGQGELWRMLQQSSVQRFAADYQDADERELRVQFRGKALHRDLRGVQLGLGRVMALLMLFVTLMPLVRAGQVSLFALALAALATVMITVGQSSRQRLELEVDEDGRATLRRSGGKREVRFEPGELSLGRQPGRHGDDEMIVIRDGEDRPVVVTNDLSHEEVGQLLAALERRPLPRARAPAVRVASGDEAAHEVSHEVSLEDAQPEEAEV